MVFDGGKSGLCPLRMLFQAHGMGVRFDIPHSAFISILLSWRDTEGEEVGNSIFESRLLSSLSSSFYLRGNCLSI